MNPTTISELRGKIAAVEDRQITLIAERDEISYDAVVERNSKAIKRLAEINAEIGNLTSEVATLNAALNEAGRRAASAAAADASAAERARAEQAAPIARLITEIGEAQDEAARRYCELNDKPRSCSISLCNLAYRPISRKSPRK